AEAAKSAATARVLKAVAPPAEGFESVLGVEATLPAAAGETFKALEARLAFRVDLATIEGLAFFLLAEDFVSCVEFPKSPRRPRVVLIGVRMQLLRLPAERALDLRGARGLRHPKDLIGVTHPQSLPGKSVGFMPVSAPIVPIMWWGLPWSATREPQASVRSPALYARQFALRVRSNRPGPNRAARSGFGRSGTAATAS